MPNEGPLDPLFRKLDRVHRRLFILATCVLAVEVALFALCGYLAQRNHESIALALVFVSSFAYAIPLFSSRVLLNLFVVDRAIDMLGFAAMRHELLGKSLIKWYMQYAMLGVALHGTTLLRLIFITPFFVADNKISGVILIGTLLWYLKRWREGKLEATLAKSALWTSVVVLIGTILVSFLLQLWPELSVYIEMRKSEVRMERLIENQSR